MTVREPEYNDHDRALIAASYAADQAPRGRHGLLLSEATDPAHQHDWEVRMPRRDYAQQALDREQAAYLKKWGDADMDSLLWRVQRRPDA